MLCWECGEREADEGEDDTLCSVCKEAYRQDDEDTRRGINDALDADMMEGF